MSKHNPELKGIIEQAIGELKKKKEFDKDAGALIASLEEGLVKALTPAFEKMAEGIVKSVSGIKIESPKIEIPPIKIPTITVPEIKLPTINVPQAKVTVNSPTVNVPPIQIPPASISEVSLKGVDGTRPLPVLLMGTDGKPYMFPAFGGSAGGPRTNQVAIKNILTAFGDSVMDEVNDAIRTNIVASVGLSVTQVSGAANSVNVIQIGGTNISVDSGVTGAGVQRVVHVTDVATSVNVSSFSASVQVHLATDAGNTVMDELNDAARVNIVADDATLTTRQVSGAADSVVINSADVTLGVNQLSGANWSVEVATQPITFDVRQVSGSSHSVEVATQPISFEVRQTSGFSDSVNVVGFTSSVAVVLQTPAGTDITDELNDALRVNVVADDATLVVRQVSGASNSVEVATQPISFEVRQTSGFSDSVNVVGFTSSVAVVLQTPAGTDITDELNDAARVNIVADDATLAVRQVSGAVDSVEIASQQASLLINQLSGANWSVEVATQPITFDVRQVSGAANSVVINSADVSLSVLQASGFTNSVNLLQIAGTSTAVDSGVTGAGVLRVVHVTDVGLSAQVVGDVANGTADSGSPVKVGGQARTTNPTTVADAARVNFIADKVGRQVVTPIHVRDLRRTAYATLNTNTETTLFAGVAGVFHDLVTIMFANTSAGAIAIDLRDATAGGIVATINCPAEATQGASFPMPYPQNAAADTWTVDFNDADISNTTVFVDALFSREV